MIKRTDALLLALGLAACGHDHDDHDDLGRAELSTLGASAVLLAVWTDEDGWRDAAGGALSELPDPVAGDAGLEPLRAGGPAASLAVRFFDRDGDEIELGTVSQDPQTMERQCTENHARYAPVDDQTAVIAWPSVAHPDNPGGSFQFALRGDGELVGLFHCDHVDIYPESEGTIDIELLLFHGDHADDHTSRLAVRVEAAGG